MHSTVKNFYYLLNLVLLLFPVCTFSQYTGGQGRGSSNSNLSPITCATFGLNPYAGGINDGHANFVLTNSSCSQTGLNPFAGGINDGHANFVLTNSSCSQTGLNPFAGGINDGHSNALVRNTICNQIGLNPYAGGISDGHANFSILNFISNDCLTLLPINLISLNVTCNNDAEIEWITASEVNNDFYTIERSNNDITWHTIAKIDGAGYSSSPIHYKFIDSLPNYGTNYYRLKQTDFDGTSIYFNALAVSCLDEEKSILTINPNPSSGIFQIKGLQENSTITIINAIGEIVATSNCSTDNCFIDIKFKSEGIYFAVIKNNLEVITKKICLSKEFN